MGHSRLRGRPAEGRFQAEGCPDQSDGAVCHFTTRGCCLPCFCQEPCARTGLYIMALLPELWLRSALGWERESQRAWFSREPLPSTAHKLLTQLDPRNGILSC